MNLATVSVTERETTRAYFCSKIEAFLPVCSFFCSQFMGEAGPLDSQAQAPSVSHPPHWAGQLPLPRSLVFHSSLPFQVAVREEQARSEVAALLRHARLDQPVGRAALPA